MSPAGEDRRYVRAVERAWSDLLGRPAVVSPREFETIDGWWRRGVPLAVVLEVIASLKKRRSGRAPKVLTALSRDVDEAFAVVAAGRAGPALADRRPERSEALRAWGGALDRCRKGDPLHVLLTGLLAEAATGESGHDFDGALDDALSAAVPAEMLASATEQTERALQDFRPRMSQEEFRKTFRRALVDRLRQTLGLPRLSLTRSASLLADGAPID